ncbi:MAG TPA: S41 family peptidase [Elusimicrobiales bacterium]|nr:S41 family peptidase [Elusimicrobiales bacterium]
MLKNKTVRVLLLALAAFGLGMASSKTFYAADLTYQQLKVLVDILDYVRDDYVEETDAQKLVYGAAEGIVRQLDDFSQFMDPELSKKVKSDTDGEFGGLGIRIAVRDGYITIITPMPGTPAYKSGLLPGDRIVKIENELTKDMDADVVVSRLRGKPGTKVTITIAREPENKNAPWITKEMTLVRETIKPEVVQHRMLENKIGYLHIVDFSGHVSEEVDKALADLKKNGMESLVLDLRYNPGGLLNAAVELCKYFLDGNKMIVYTKGRKPENYAELRSNKTAVFANLPLIVLVNGGSASGSEIVAGALQDHKRGIIIGSRTFGKASVQTIIPLADGSGLRLTVAKYYTPSGRSIHRNPKDNSGGIAPDIEVKISREDEIKIMEQYDKIYTPGKEPVAAVKNEIGDQALERAVQILKAREAFATLGKSVS